MEGIPLDNDQATSLRGWRCQMTWSVGAGLEGKGVIVTGAAGGIGKEVAKAFSTTGARVMVVDLKQEAADSVLPELEGKGHRAVAADLTKFSAHVSLIRRHRAQ